MATRAIELPDPSKQTMLGDANSEDTNRLADDRNNNAQEKVLPQLPPTKDPVIISKREESEDSPKALVINESPVATDLKNEVLKASTLRVIARSPDNHATGSPRNQSILPHLGRESAHDEKERSGEFGHGKGFSEYFFSSSATAPAGTGQLKVEPDCTPKRHNRDFEPATTSSTKMILSLNSTEASDAGQQLPLFESDSSGKSRLKTGNQVASMQSAQVKPRCTPAREAVDPAKYFTLTDEPDGTKYACSKCGNVYKWRKSLNKHWKEKHDGETPSLHSRPPPALLQRDRFMNMSYRNASKHSVFHPSSFHGSSSKSSGLVISPPRVHPTAQGGKNSPHVMSPFMFAKFPVKDDSRDVGKTIPHLEEPVTAVVKPNRADHSPAAALSSWSWLHSPNRPLLDFASQTKLRVPAVDSIKSAHDHGPVKDTPTRMFSAIQSHHTLRGGPLDLSGTLVSPSSSANDNILDLSCKSTEVSRVSKGPLSVQDEPLDFSTKPSSGKPSTQSRNATPTAASDASFLLGRHPERKDTAHKTMVYLDEITEIHSSPFPMHDFEKQNPLVCASCRVTCPTMSDLNYHFARHHMNVIYEAAVDIMNSAQRGVPTPLTSPNGTQLYKYLMMESPMKRSLACIVCGMSVQWSWMLNKHFEQMHSSIQPNPYKKQPAVSASAVGAYDVDSHGHSSVSTTCHRCNSCSFTTDSKTEFARHQLKHSLTKEKKEFLDSTSMHPQEDDFDQEEDVVLKCRDGSPLDHFSDGIIDLEGEGTAIVIPQAPEETSLGSPPGCTSRGKSKDAAASAKEISANYSDLSFDGGMMISGEHTAIVIPQAPEETSIGSSQMNVTPPGSKSGRGKKDTGSSAESLLPFKCELCEYRARWPSEMMQHMKNHSDEKPYQCPQCSYRSKWKWDVVKHLKRCGGGGSVKDVIDTSQKKKSYVKSLLVDTHSRPSSYEGVQSFGALNFHSIYDQQSMTKSRELSKGPPNVTIYSTAGDMHGNQSETDNFDNCDSEDAVSEDLSGNKSEPGSGEASQSTHACPQCPFVGHSPAELKRHLRVHSDEKPYSCQTCCYSSKWKCDLKKHLKAYNHVSAVPLIYGGHGRKPVSWSSSADHASYVRNQDSGEMRVGDGADSDLRALLQGGAKVKKGFGTGNGASRPSSRDSGNIFGGITSGGRLKCRQCEFEAIDITSFLQHKKIHRSPMAKKHEGGGPVKVKALPPSNHHRRKSFKQTRVLQISSLKEEDVKMEGVSDGESDDENAEGKRFWESLGLRSTSSVNREKQMSDESDDTAEDSSDPETEVEFSRSELASKRARYDDSPDNREFQKQCSATSNSCESNTDTEVEYLEVSDLTPYQARTRDELGFEDAEYGRKYEGNRDTKVNGVRPALKQPFPAVRRGIRQGVTTTEAEDAVGMSKRKRKLRTCEKCGYITDNLTTLQRHAAKHGSAGRHRCSKCDYSVDRQHVLNYHIKIVHEGGGQEAEIKVDDWNCEPVKMDKPGGREKRMESSALVKGEGYKALDRSGKRKIVCTTSVITVLGHEMEMIQKGNKTWYNCIKCHFVSSNITNAVNHAKQHGANKKYKCRFCDYSLNRQSSIVNHMNSQHSNSDLLQFTAEAETESEKLVVGQWRNEWPGKDVQERYSLLDKMNLRWRKDVCIKCGFCSINGVKMLLHRLAHGRRDKTFGCDTCSHRSTSSRLLAGHMKSHKQEAGHDTAIKMLSCSRCPFQTGSAAKHEEHLYCHDAGYTNKCTECSFSTDHVSVLKEHAKVHQDGKGKGYSRCRKATGCIGKLRCPFCPFMSVSKIYFAIHMKHHNSTKKLSCSVCSFRANVRNVFYHHQKLHR